MKDRRAFTLIELLVVVSIISLLSSVVLSQLNAAREKARIGAARSFEAGLHRVAGELALGLWDFSEGSGTAVADRSGNGNGGTLVGSPSWSTDTPWGTGYSINLNGSTQYMTTPLSRSNQNPFTIMAWYKYEGGAGDCYRALFGGASTDFYVGKNCGGLNVGVQDGGYNSAVAVGTNAWDGKWHHMAYVYSGGTGKIYLDGKEAGSASFGGGSGAVWIGLENEGGGYYFQGKVTSVRAFQKGLVASEIEAIYALESPATKTVSLK
ncbi:MAG: prepilin-type N-terminal cleavage/methylation domain-containing protein [Candidatus Taylorbacteria bacterium]|nr:prepilin-type N-terminal cleavage/methylation domain-containing protein [Candidatus Taylorbacteria bacterium]